MANQPLLTCLVETDWLIDFYIGRSDQSRILDGLEAQGLAVSIVAHGELFEGAFDFPDTALRLARIRAFLARFQTLPLTEPIMEIFGRTRSELRRCGQSIQDLDLLIGATAVYHDLIVLTGNVRHFSRIPRLQLYQST